MDTGTVVIITLVAYKLALIGVGLWASRRTHSNEDFFLGNRGLGPWVAAISYSASASSAWTLLGLSGAAYVLGLSAIWIALGSIIGMFVAWLWVAKRVQRLTRMQNYLTVTDLLAGDTVGQWREKIVLSISFIILFSFTFYVAAQFQGAGVAFAETFGLPTTASILIGSAIILFYTLIGGFWAVSLTDTIQGSVMAIAAIILPIMTLIHLGGFEAFWHAFLSVGTSSQISFNADQGWLLSLGVIFGGLSIGFGTYGQPHLLVRFMALRDDAARRQAIYISSAWYFIVFFGMIFVGLAARVLFEGLGDAEKVFFLVANQVLHPVVAGLLIAAVLSAIMSTADSQLLVSASVLSHDLKLEQRLPNQRLIIGRVAVLFMVVIAALVALYLPSQIFTRVLFAWVGLGAAFGPLLFAKLLGWQLGAAHQFMGIWIGFSLAVILSWMPNTVGDIAERLMPFALHMLYLILMRKS